MDDPDITSDPDPDQRWADFQEWMQHGVNEGWCTLPVCVTHDGLPMTDGEERLWEEGSDPCQHALRLWSGDEP